MGLETRGRITEIEDKDTNVAAPASDERLELVRTLLDSMDTDLSAIKTDADATAAANANKDSITTFDHTTSGTQAEALASNAVPDGTKVLVQAKSDNSGSVYVGNSTTQVIELSADQSITLEVSNTDLVHVQTPTAGDGVNVLFEG